MKPNNQSNSESEDSLLDYLYNRNKVLTTFSVVASKEFTRNR